MKAAAALLLLCAGCELVNRFDPSVSTEDHESVCADGLDNDGNGLTDCQEFGCLGFAHCCDLPSVVIDQQLAAPACSTDAIDRATWQVWGDPLPQVCLSGWTPNKSEQCYDVGMLSVAPVPLKPGLHVEAALVGTPETGGRVEVGVTDATTISSPPTFTTCGPFAGPRALFSLREVRADVPGAVDPQVQLVARLDDSDAAYSPALAAAPHTLAIDVLADGSVRLCVDATAWCWTAPMLLASTDATGHVFVQGRGLALSVQSVRVTSGNQCETPAGWTPVAPSPFYRGGLGWEAGQVSDPTVIATSGSNVRLYYCGCAALTGTGACDHSNAVGVLDSDAGFAAAGAPVLLLPNTLRPSAGALRTLDPFVAEPTLYVETVVDLEGRHGIFRRSEPDLMQVSPPEVLPPGQPGSWDDAGVFGPTALVGPDGVVRLWFAGRSAADGLDRIGLATSTDGGMTFVPEPSNPVLRPGAPGDFDARETSEPEVVWDASRRLYRMWYRARGFPAGASIGYAVSTDGVSWHKFPGNPVLGASALGLDDVGGPTVLQRAGDARLRMWLHGRPAGAAGLALYATENAGTPAP